ncbi:hypothetical protein K491DRAFT_716689 [Lophiostoma macrostomum CBS 122681]|uniref:Centrosomin N-terminal motif 1 domain-containing protein n=1 Tax=Lophiostoma macrostomum CBS 122681 TaxID=1314788 RepID=A0A6A6T5H0_9PLEO|nr:hypothetical protein K491DRAFT_716689 [Lophiostoma macrostomum CBS 122681]
MSSPMRRSARDTTHTPSATRSASTSMRTSSRPGTASLEPKSDYLRSALEARRAKDGLPSPSSAESRPTLQRTLSEATPPAASSMASSVDPWLDQAASEEDITPIRTSRRTRRPSESALPRLPTQREQQATNEGLRRNLFDLNMKYELVSKQNHELKDKLEEAEKRIEELEPLEEVIEDLRADIDTLTLKMQDMEEVIHDVQDKLEESEETNQEWAQIQEEAVANMEQQTAALDEAADIIIQLQKEKSLAQQEIEKLRAEVSRHRDPSPANSWRSPAVSLDGHAGQKQPARVYSIDESRPSTSHLHSDSDYFSQPGSPQVKTKKPSKERLAFEARAKAFQEMNASATQITQTLKKRMSDASIKNVPRLKSPSPRIPQIAEEENETSHRVARPSKPSSSRRHVQLSQEKQLPPLTTERPATATVSTVAPRTPTTPVVDKGLRGYYREPKSLEKPTRPSTSYKSPSPLKGFQHGQAESPRLLQPQRDSSHSAHTSSSEKLKASSSETLKTETAPSEYADSVPTEYAESIPPPPSLISEPELTEPDSGKWWKDTRKIRTTSGRRPSHGLEALANGPMVPNGNEFGGAPSLFNASEGEDQFMTKAQRYMAYGGHKRI